MTKGLWVWYILTSTWLSQKEYYDQIIIQKSLPGAGIRHSGSSTGRGTHSQDAGGHPAAIQKVCHANLNTLSGYAGRSSRKRHHQPDGTLDRPVTRYCQAGIQEYYGVSIVTNFYDEDITPAEAMANSSSYAMSDMYYQPPGTMPPMVQPFDPTASKPLMLLTVSSDEKSGKELYDVAYYSLRQMLSGVEGIIAPAAYGGALRRIYILVDPARLEARGISQTRVMEAIQKNTTMIPSGIAEIGNINYGIEAQGLIEKVEEFNDIVVGYENGDPIA